LFLKVFLHAAVNCVDFNLSAKSKLGFSRI